MYSPLLYNERHTSPIQYTKNINGMASLVDAIRKILEKYNTLRHYRILCATCTCKVVDRKERKKLMIKHRKKHNTIKQWSQQRKIFLEKKQFRDMKNNQEIQKKLFQKYKTMDTG